MKQSTHKTREMLKDGFLGSGNRSVCVCLGEKAGRPEGFISAGVAFQHRDVGQVKALLPGLSSLPAPRIPIPSPWTGDAHTPPTDFCRKKRPTESRHQHSMSFIQTLLHSPPPGSRADLPLCPLFSGLGALDWREFVGFVLVEWKALELDRKEPLEHPDISHNGVP